jgi:hypothetical protein
MLETLSKSKAYIWVRVISSQLYLALYTSTLLILILNSSGPMQCLKWFQLQAADTWRIKIMKMELSGYWRGSIFM